jgi:hypothetical protein
MGTPRASRFAFSKICQSLHELLFVDFCFPVNKVLFSSFFIANFNNSESHTKVSSLCNYSDESLTTFFLELERLPKDLKIVTDKQWFLKLVSFSLSLFVSLIFHSSTLSLSLYIAFIFASNPEKQMFFFLVY